MIAPRFLVAKYVPDTHKMEPRNFGVILWYAGRVASRFIGSRSPISTFEGYPTFVRKKNYPVYREWVDYWRTLLRKDALPVPEIGTVGKDSSQFLDALKARCRDKFILVDGGILTSSIDPADLEFFADKLFENIVSDGIQAPDSESIALRRETRRVISAAGLQHDPRFKRSMPIQYNFRGVSRHVKFTFGIFSEGKDLVGHPAAAFQTAKLNDQRDVNNALFLFDGVVQNRILSKSRCATLIHRPSAESEEAAEAIQSLSQVGEVIDVSQVDDAAERVRAIIDEEYLLDW
jgi:hypothetical protein